MKHHLFVNTIDMSNCQLFVTCDCISSNYGSCSWDSICLLNIKIYHFGQGTNHTIANNENIYHFPFNLITLMKILLEERLNTTKKVKGRILRGKKN